MSSYEIIHKTVLQEYLGPYTSCLITLTIPFMFVQMLYTHHNAQLPCTYQKKFATCKPLRLPSSLPSFLPSFLPYTPFFLPSPLYAAPLDADFIHHAHCPVHLEYCPLLPLIYISAFSCSTSLHLSSFIFLPLSGKYAQSL